ncbi:helix-turn-helix transcriptional regulator [Gordonia sp. zg691]|nr:helix-turn-helix transcriptional regulator [Gordonia jinghuaiqii]
MPEVVRGGDETVFRLDVGTTPAGAVRVGAALDDDAVAGVRAYLAAVGASIELIGLRRRRTRQDELFAPLLHGIGMSGFPDDLGGRTAAPTPPSSLTAREREIFSTMLSGASNASIARELVVSVETVKSHVKKVLSKCGVTNRAELIGRYAVAPDMDV